MSVVLDPDLLQRQPRRHHLNPVPIAQILTRPVRRIALIRYIQNVIPIRSISRMVVVTSRPVNTPALSLLHRSPVLRENFEAVTNCNRFQCVLIYHAFHFLATAAVVAAALPLTVAVQTHANVIRMIRAASPLF